jgi:SulP family sulfate permease
MARGWHTRLKRLLPSRRDLGPDLLAGTTSGIAQIPDAMASGVLAGVSPVHGLYAVIAGTPVAALATGSVFMAVVPTSALSVAAREAISGRSGEEQIRALATLTLLVGVLQLAAGLLRLGSLVRFVSNAVMTGFLSGIGVLIVLGQLGDLTGYRSEEKNAVMKLADLLGHLDDVHPPTLLVGMLTIGVIVGIGRTRLAPMAMLLGLAAAGLLAHLAGLEGVRLVGHDARIPRALPLPALPDLALVPGLMIPALGLTVIGLVQGAGVSQSSPNPDGRYPDASRDFSGQGVANLAAGLFRGMPIGGSLSTTALVSGAGARSRLANLVSGLVVAAGVLVAGGAVELLPSPALAGLLIVAGAQTLNRERIAAVVLTSWPARLVMALTFAATLASPLQLAVLAGVALSVVVHVYRAVDHVALRELALDPRGIVERTPPATLPAGVTVFIPYGDLFFAGARSLEEQLPRVEAGRRAVVLLLLRGRKEMGSTFIGVLDRYARALRAEGGKLVLVGASDTLLAQLERTGAAAALGRENVFPARSRYGEAFLAAFAAAHAWFGAEQPPVPPPWDALLARRHGKEGRGAHP